MVLGERGTRPLQGEYTRSGYIVHAHRFGQLDVLDVRLLDILAEIPDTATVLEYLLDRHASA